VRRLALDGLGLRGFRQSVHGLGRDAAPAPRTRRPPGAASTPSSGRPARASTCALSHRPCAPTRCCCVCARGAPGRSRGRPGRRPRLPRRAHPRGPTARPQRRWQPCRPTSRWRGPTRLRRPTSPRPPSPYGAWRAAGSKRRARGGRRRAASRRPAGTRRPRAASSPTSASSDLHMVLTWSFESLSMPILRRSAPSSSSTRRWPTTPRRPPRRPCLRASSARTGTRGSGSRPSAWVCAG